MSESLIELHQRVERNLEDLTKNTNASHALLREKLEMLRQEIGNNENNEIVLSVATALSLGGVRADVHGGNISVHPDTGVMSVNGWPFLIKRIQALEEGIIGVPTQDLPVANAGADRTVSLPNTEVTLTGSGSSEGYIASTLWSLVSGANTPTIENPSSTSTNVTGLIEGEYVFRFTVTDNIGQTAFSDVNVTVKEEAIANFLAFSRSGFEYVGAHSMDSINWARLDSPPPFHVLAAIYADNRFVVVGFTHVFIGGMLTVVGRSAHSTDGINWTTTATGALHNNRMDLRAIAWGNGRYVVGDSQGRLAHSVNGITWQLVAAGNNPIDAGILSIIWDGGRFVAATSTRLFQSTNGTTWTQLANSFPFPFTGLRSIAWGNGRYVVLNGSVSILLRNLIAFSRDATGTAFNAVEGELSLDGNTPSLNTVVWGNGRFVAAGTRIVYSADGINWTEAPNSPSLGSFSSSGVLTYNNEHFLLGSENGLLAYSTDGINWTAVNSSTLNDRISAVVCR